MDPLLRLSETFQALNVTRGSGFMRTKKKNQSAIKQRWYQPDGLGLVNKTISVM